MGRRKGGGKKKKGKLSPQQMDHFFPLSFSSNLCHNHATVLLQVDMDEAFLVHTCWACGVMGGQWSDLANRQL